MGIIEILFKEYDAIRAEILTGLSGRNTILSVGVTAIGIMWTAATALHKTDPLITGLVLVWAVPPVAFSILWIWFGEYRRVQKAGAHQLRLEKRINDQARKELKINEELLTHETFLRQSRRRSWFDPVVVLLCMIVLLSVLVGLGISLFYGNEYIFLLGLGWLPLIGVVYSYIVWRIRGLRGQ